MAVLLCGAPAAVAAACSGLGGTTSTWTDGNGLWSNAGNWDNGVPNSGGVSACIADGTSTVSLDMTASVDDLQLASGNILNTSGNTFLYVYGTQIINAGQINVNANGGYDSRLYIQNNITLTGGGTLTLNSSNATAWLYLSGNLDNVDNTIQGNGIIYNSGTTITNEVGGTINANVSGSALNLQYGTVNNAGLLEATNGGVLNLYANQINNGGANITGGAGSYVQLYGSTTIIGGTLNNNGAAFFGTPASSAAFLDGSTGAGAITLNGTYTTDWNAATYLYGTFHNNGNFQVNGVSGYDSRLYIQSNATLTNGGTVTLNSGNANAWLYLGANLDNVNNLIQGNGYIYNSGTTITNEAGGTINANVSGSALNLQYGTVNNAGLITATNGGVLNLYANHINNGAANITGGAGTVVNFYGNTDIVGGTLNNNGATFFGTPDGYAAYLDGSTGAGPITVNGTYTTGSNSQTLLYGAIHNNGNFQVNAVSGYDSRLYIQGNATLTGGGTVTLNSGNANAYLYLNGVNLDNVNNLIQGNGIIWNNGTTLTNEVGGTINANVSGSALNLQYGTVNNSGLLEATNGSTLNLYGTTIHNAGSNITASGPGAVVNLYGGTDIVGGTLNNNGAAFFGTPDGYSAYLDGSTNGALTLNGSYTTGSNSQTFLYGAIHNNGNFKVNAISGYNSNLYIQSNTTLDHGGTVTLNSGNATAYLYLNGVNLDNIDNTIHGGGAIWNNGTTLTNEPLGTINADVSGASMTLYYGTVNNNGLIEATNGSTLRLDSNHVNNAGGNITANGPGTYVQLFGGTVITGGTLNNNGGTFFGTPDGYTANLDGSTAAGAVTLNGTYSTGSNSNTFLYGAIHNNGNFQVNGISGYDSHLYIQSPVTLTGGGTVTLNSGNATAWLYLNGVNLDNVDNTIQGNGGIYNNGTVLTNEAAGTILANVPGSGLTVLYGTTTNLGTMQVNPGSYLHLLAGNLTNFAGNTLTGGTYNVYGTTPNPGTLQIDSLGTTGGEIVNNAATILLDGPNSNFLDQVGLDALSNFSNNSGSFTIRNGRNFTSPGAFNTSGAVTVGAGSTFTSTGNYNQNGGSTKLDGALVAGSGNAFVNAGTLLGNGGTVTGNVTMNGTLSPGDNTGTAGVLNIVGNYVQTGTGVFQLDLGGLTAGGGFDLLNVTGNANLNGTLNVSLINGFFPLVGNTFTFLMTGGTRFGQFSAEYGLNIGNNEQLSVLYGGNFVELTTGYISTYDPWLGGTGDWSNGNKWGLGVPTSAYDVGIYSGGDDLVTLNMGSTVINSLTVGGATNGFTSTLIDGGVAQSLNINNALTVGPSGVLTLTGGSTITAGASSTNAGAISIGTGSTFSTSGAFTQSGGSTKLDGSLMAGANVFINGGTLLGNGGTITGTVTMAGTLSPGDTAHTAGALSIVGNYVQTALGVFQLDIGGTQAGTFDLLTVNGQAYLAGTLDIFLINGFVPSDGQMFTFLVTDPGVFGVFATVNGLNYANGYFTVAYNADTVALDFHGNQQPVPEPGTFLMLGSGLLGVAYTARRRWLK